MADLPVRAFDARVNPGEDGAVLLVRGSDVYELDDVGGFIWRRCDGNTTVDGIAGALAQEYDVPEETARADVATFVRDLRAAQLLEP
jgi:pyrroloquinoline quinone biosynthesis protein D